MKRIFAMALVFLMIFTLAACKKEPEPVPTQPPVEVTLPQEEEPVERPTEYIPDIEIETMPPVLTDDMDGGELAAHYAEFMKNYDWKQHNGFTSETSSILFTYIFADDAFMVDARQKSELYEGSYNSRKVRHFANGTLTEYVMCNQGSFASVIPQEIMLYPTIWELYNENTESHYVHTNVTDRIYDVVEFNTTWLTYTGDVRVYTIQDKETGHTMSVMWDAIACVVYDFDTNIRYLEGVVFDPDNKTLTIDGHTTTVDILESPEEFNESASQNIHALLYIDRDTQTVVYMEDYNTATKVYFLTDASTDFTMPANVNMDSTYSDTYIDIVFEEFLADANRYLSPVQ